MKIYLIRHGETLANKQHLYIGVTDVSISDEGANAIRTKAESGYYPCADGKIIYTSGMIRTIQTLQLIYGEIPYLVEARFRESDFGIFEGKSYEDLKEDEDYIRWISGDNFSNQCPGGESYVMMKKRVMEGFYDMVAKHKEEGKDIVVILHSGPIVAIMESLHPDETKTYYDWRLDNGDYYCIEL